ncbi:MAG: hypothetical protein ACXVZW_03100, partial [Gaiellaceae bacterium]
MPGATGHTYLERSLRAHSLVLLAGSVLALAALLGVASATGWPLVIEDVEQIQPLWFLVAVAGEALAYVGYVISFREVARVESGPVLDHSHATAIVTAGFGAFVARGGLAVDFMALRDAGVSQREARVRVLGLGALEYAVLGPAACGAAALLMVQGSRHPGPALILPWVISVPLGFVVALWAVEHRERFR